MSRTVRLETLCALSGFRRGLGLVCSEAGGHSLQEFARVAALVPLGLIARHDMDA